MISNIYETLGVSKDATAEEVKKAYFKLIRVHSPQNDPEGFQTIRQAYEAYMKGDILDTDAFAISSPEEKAAINELSQLIDQRRFAQAKAEGGKFTKQFPDSDYLRYLYCIALRNCSNTTLAVKAIEPLIKKHSENKLVMKEYALACMARKWNNKASIAFHNAMKAGVCDPEFISNFLAFMKEDHTFPLYAKDTISKYYKNLPKVWSESTIQHGINIAGYACKLNCERDKCIENVLDLVTQFPSQFDPDLLMFFSENFLDHALEYADPEIYENLKKLHQTFLRLPVVANSDNAKNLLELNLMNLNVYELQIKCKLSKNFCTRYYLYLKGKKQTPSLPDQFLFINMQLSILLEDPRFTKEQEEAIAKEVPEFYKIFQPTFYKLQLPENKITSLIKKLKKDLKKYSFEAFYDKTYGDIFEDDFEDYDLFDDDDDDDYDDFDDFYNDLFNPRATRGDIRELERSIRELEELLNSPNTPDELKEYIQMLVNLQKLF